MKFIRTSTITVLAAFVLSTSVSGFLGLLGRSETVEEPRAVVRQWEAGTTQTVDRPRFTFRFPSNWKMATGQSDYDPDTRFTIDSPSGQSYVSIETFEADSDTDIESMIKGLKKTYDGPLIDTSSRSKVTRWGNFKGEGLHLKGEVMSIEPGGVRFFVTVQNGFGLIVTEYYFASEFVEASQCFELIASTFTIKG